MVNCQSRKGSEGSCLANLLTFAILIVSVAPFDMDLAFLIGKRYDVDL